MACRRHREPQFGGDRAGQRPDPVRLPRGDVRQGEDATGGEGGRRDHHREEPERPHARRETRLPLAIHPLRGPGAGPRVIHPAGGCPLRFPLRREDKEIELERDFQASIFGIRLQAMQPCHIEKHFTWNSNFLLSQHLTGISRIIINWESIVASMDLPIGLGCPVRCLISVRPIFLETNQWQ